MECSDGVVLFNLQLEVTMSTPGVFEVNVNLIGPGDLSANMNLLLFYTGFAMFGPRISSSINWSEYFSSRLFIDCLPLLN